MSSKYTFGIEIECVLIVPAQYGEDQQDEVEKLVHAELARPMQAKCRVSGCTIDHSHKLPIKDPGSDDHGYTKWTIKNDTSVKLTSREELSKEWQLCDDAVAYSIEIVSRVLNLDGYTKVPEDVADEHGPVELHWKDEIAHVCKALNSFNMEPDFRCYVNKTTGLHVHLGKGVGDGDKINIPYQVTRGLASMFTAFERQIDSVFTTKRIGGYSEPHVGSLELPFVANAQVEPFVTDKTAEYAYPMSRLHLVNLEDNKRFINVESAISRDISWGEAGRSPVVADRPENQAIVRELAKTEKERAFNVHFPFNVMEGNSRLQTAVQGYDVPNWLYLLSCTANYKDLKAYWPGRCNFKSSAVNIALLFNEVPFDRTVEIRAHPGTIDTDEICAWVDVVGSMAKICESQLLSQLTEFFLNGLSDFSFLDLVRAIGCSEETQVHYRSKLEDPHHAILQRDLLTSRQDQTEPLAGFYRIVQEQRCIESDRRNVDERIRHKFESGLYGQFPYRFVVDKLGVELANSVEGKRLIMQGSEEQ